MRVGLITTLQTNIGDDMIREGICSVIREAVGSESVTLKPVNKHQPWNVYPAWHPGQMAKLCEFVPKIGRRLSRFVDRGTSLLKHSKFDDCGLIVQCGAPVLWPNCHKCEWRFALWDHVIGRLHERIPIINLAAGSCYPWESQPALIEDEHDAFFLRSILGYCSVTTVRDRLAQDLVRSLGWTAELIPCSALVASADLNPAPMPENAPILINYMVGGGHYGWNQGIEAEAWLNVVRDLILRLRRRHRVAMLCHDQGEALLAAACAPDCEIIWPKTIGDYFQAVSTAKGGVCNRMHASVALAGLGIPSVAVCTDTRLLMVEAIGLPCFYVKEVSAEMLEHAVEDLVSKRAKEKERLRELQRHTRNRYLDIIRAVV